MGKWEVPGGSQLGGGQLCRESHDGESAPQFSKRAEILLCLPPSFINQPQCGWHAPEHMEFTFSCSSL